MRERDADRAQARGAVGILGDGGAADARRRQQQLYAAELQQQQAAKQVRGRLWP
jgi:hypothetical protein